MPFHLIGEEVPEWMERELMDFSGMKDLVMYRDRSLVGFSMDGGLEESVQRILIAMADKGWIPVASGIDGIYSMAKKEGDVRWMIMQCVEERDCTSVVLHIGRD